MPNRRCLQINSVIFRSCSCYVFMQKLGFLFLVKGVKISAIFSSFTKTTEQRNLVPRASLLPSFLLAIACSIDVILLNIAKRLPDLVSDSCFNGGYEVGFESNRKRKKN